MNKFLFTKIFPFRRIAGLMLMVFLFAAVFAVKAQKTRQLIQEESENGESRTALVIGNGAYTDSPLKNPANDAADMAATLKALGFEVLHYTNLDQNSMKKAIRDFGTKLRTKKGVGLFYYAGHGVQVKGTNYLIPVSASVNTEEEIEYESVEVGLVLAQMEAAKNSMNIVILDACRNNPFARSFRSAEKGLASIDAPAGTILAYSTAPGSVASDGTGRNGLYTQELLKTMQTSGLSIEDVFKRVRISVRGATADKQTPWESSSLTGNFYFSLKDKTVSNSTSSSVQNPANMEDQNWNNIKNSQNVEDFKAYLKEYTNGKYAQLARQKLRELSKINSKDLSVKSNPPASDAVSTETSSGPFAVLADADGKLRRFSEFQGAKGTVIMFMSAQCPVDKAYQERINETARIYKAKGFRFVGLNANSTESGEMIKQNQSAYTFPILIDKGNAVADKLGANITPEIFVFDASGKLLYKGAIDDDRRGENISSNYLRDALDRIIEGKDVLKNSVTPFGCSIKKVN